MKSVSKDVVDCQKCPRLVKYCRSIANEKRAAFRDWNYWGRPVPNFGDKRAELLIVGLAPAAHGANRTGRMFTGDRSGEWLYRAMYKSGFANQPNSESKSDGLILHNALVTAVGHCAPPGNKPTNHEIKNCENWLIETFDKTPFRVVIALGAIAWAACLRQLLRQDFIRENSINGRTRMPKFGHGTILELSDGRALIGSYHPSQQNTFTGKLTEPMFDKIFSFAKKRITEEI